MRATLVAVALSVLCLLFATPVSATEPVRYSDDGTYLVGLNFDNVFVESQIVNFERRIGEGGISSTSYTVAQLTHRQCDGSSTKMLEIKVRLSQAEMSAGIRGRLVATLDGKTSGSSCLVVYEVPRP